MKKISGFLFGSLLTSLFAGIAFAQTTDRITAPTGDVYVISAKAGGVSYVEGVVSIIRKDGKSGVLVKDDQIEAGDKIATGATGRAEVLLNPGSFLRVGENSGFEFITTGLDDLKLKITKGSAIIEILASDEFSVGVELPNGKLNFTRSGVFRIDFLTDGSAKVSVWKGKLFLDDDTEIKSGRTAVIGGGEPTTGKFDRDGGDDLDLWSKLRAKEIAAVNARLQRDSLRNSLLNAYNGGRWNAFNSFGLWVFDPIRRMWCFLPFGSGWGSPYGYRYGFDMWYCNMPYWVYTNPTGGGGGGGGTTTVPTVPNATREQRVNDRTTPPFQRTNPDGVESRPGSNPNAPVGDNPSDRKGRSDTYDPPVFNPRNNDSTKSSPSVDSKPVISPPTPIIVMPSPKSEKDN